MTEDLKGSRPSIDQIIDIVAAEAMIDRDKLTPDTVLQDLDIQSTDFVMILMAIEEKFGIYVSVDSELADARTVGDLMRIVASRVDGAPGETV